MRWFLITAVIILGILLILLFSYVKFNIKYKFNGNSELRVNIEYLYGLLKPEIIPFDNKENTTKKDKKKNENKLSPIAQYKGLISYIFDRIVIEKLNWQTNIGYADAFSLSIIYGILWWFKSIIIGILMSYKDIKSVNIKVIPLFNTNQIDISFDCIIKIRMVYIINIWIRLLKLYKGGEGNDRSSNRRFNENYNE